MSLVSLPAEIINQITSYLPLSAVRSLVLSNPRSFYKLHGSTTHSESFAPWRRRYFRYQSIYKRAWRAMEDLAVDAHNKGQGTIVSSGEVQVRTPLEQELEEASQGMAMDLGLLPRSGIVNPGPILMPRITTTMLFTALEHVSDLRVEHLRLLPLLCPLSAIIDILGQRYPKLELIQKLVPVPLLPQSLSQPGSVAEAAATYRIFTAYLLFTSLTPNDILGVISDAMFASGKEIYNIDADKESQEKALVEYFHFLLLFLLMHEYDYKVRHGEIPRIGENISLQARRILSGRLDMWVREYFRLERPLAPSAAPTSRFPARNMASTQVPKSRWGRTASMSSPSPTPRQGSMACKSSSWSAPKSNYPYPSPSPVIQESNPGYKLTQEQKKIVDTDVCVGELMKVRAYAGTGKTMSLVEYAEKRPLTRFLYVAFNKNAALSAEKRFPRNVVCKTMHSIAYGAMEACAPIVKNALPDARKGLKDRRRDGRMPTMEVSNNFSAKEIIEMLGGLDNARISSLLVNPEEHMLPETRQKQEGKKPFPTANAVATVIKRTLAKYWSLKDVKVGRRCLPWLMVEILGLNGDIMMKMAEGLWEAMQTAKAKYLPHDAYLKMLQLNGIEQNEEGTGVGGSNVSAANTRMVARGLVRGKGDIVAFRDYGVIMWDEAQDSNPSMADIIFRQRPWVGIIVVGDPYQKIYGFRGATNEFSNDEAHRPTYTCYLTHSFRFGDGIAGVANVLLRSLRESVGINGVRKHDSVKAGLPEVLEMSLARESKEVQILKPGAVEDGGSGKYTVVFRKNITLVQYAIKYCISHSYLGHRVSLRTSGNFNKNNLFALLKNAYDLYHGKQARYGVLAGYKTWQDLKVHVDAEVSDQGVTDSPGLSLVVGLEELIASPDFLNTLKLCEDMILDDSYEEAKGDVILITTHQAKGLEWDRVIIADDFNPPYSRRRGLGKTKYWREEMFMTYVAVTRAKKELILGKRVAAWLAAEMGMYRFYVSPTQGKEKCPVCSGGSLSGGNEEDELKREGMVMGYECVLPMGSFGAAITEPKAKSRRPFGSKKDVVVCDLCAQNWYHADRSGTDIELTRFLFPIMRVLDSSQREITQMTQNGASSALVLSERGTISAVYQLVYQQETEMVDLWVEDRSALSVIAASEEEREGISPLYPDLMDLDLDDYEESEEDDIDSDPYEPMQ